MDMQKTLFISDLDGTLLNSSAKLDPESAEKLNALIARGINFTYATARSFTTAVKVAGALKLSLPVITYNGAFLVNPTDGSILESCIMTGEKLAAACAEMERLKVMPLVYAIIDGKECVSWIKGRETDGIKSYLSVRRHDRRLHPVDSYERLFDGDIFYFTIIGRLDETETLRHIFDDGYFYSHIQEDTYIKDEFWLEAYRFDSTKATAAKKVKARYSFEKTVCFGDNMNDINIFGCGDECYAVNNAIPELKAVATGVIGSNDECGVANFIWNYADNFKS